MGATLAQEDVTWARGQVLDAHSRISGPRAVQFGAFAIVCWGDRYQIVRLPRRLW